MTQTVLILGATGRFGRNAADAFWNAGWTVRLFDRARDDLTEAAQSADVIVNGWNIAYPDWQTALPELTKAVIDAAKLSGATVILPGNVYVFGEGSGPLLSQDTPHRATNPLGRARIEMENAYRAAGVQTILLRAGDFLDTEASGNWFDRIMAPPLKKGRLVYPGALDAPHAWAYLPDMARAAVRLAEMRAALPRFIDIPFSGYTLSGQAIGALCSQILGRQIAVKEMNWLSLQAARPIWPTARHLIEMRYLWSMPHRMDHTLFDAILPGFKATDPLEAVARAIAPVLPEGSDQPKPGDVRPHPLAAE